MPRLKLIPTLTKDGWMIGYDRASLRCEFTLRNSYYGGSGEWYPYNDEVSGCGGFCAMTNRAHIEFFRTKEQVDARIAELEEMGEGTLVESVALVPELRISLMKEKAAWLQQEKQQQQLNLQSIASSQMHCRHWEQSLTSDRNETQSIWPSSQS